MAWWGLERGQFWRSPAWFLDSLVSRNAVGVTANESFSKLIFS